MSTSPCTSGSRHKWAWVKNVNVVKIVYSQRGSSGRASLKGLYKCQCGAKKHGQFNPNGTDLRNTTGVTL